MQLQGGGAGTTGPVTSHSNTGAAAQRRKRQAAAKPAPRPAAAPVRQAPVNYGGGGGGSYGGGVGSNSRGYISAISTPKPPPAPPSLAAFLGHDTTYLSQQSQLRKAMADYLAQQGQARNKYQTGFLGNMDTLKKSRTEGLTNLENDFASRGMLTSGLYADSMGDLNSDFDKQQSDLEKARAEYLAQLASDLTNFKSEQTLTTEKAKQEAAARRAAQYGL